MDLKWFAETHLGVGNPSLPIWYVGPEPAGGSTDEEIALVLADAVRQEKPITNLRDHLINIGQTKWFDRKVSPTQPYWRRIAWLELVARLGKDEVTIDDARNFQVSHMLSKASRRFDSLCPLMLETSALPSKSTKLWPYEKHGLPSRIEYMARILPKRMKQINMLICTYRPHAVVMLGAFHDRWAMIQRVEGVVYKVLPHPNAHGYTDNDWTAFGLSLRLEIAQARA